MVEVPAEVDVDDGVVVLELSELLQPAMVSTVAVNRLAVMEVFERMRGFLF